MEGPTPVSALLHAATMVTAGVYLLIRSITALSAALMALTQNDIKKIIAYSTMSQLGYTFLACGISQFDLAIFHIVNHGFFKALLFLSAGGIIHSINDEQNIFKMGGIIHYDPLLYIAILSGSLSLMAFPFLTGFYSKDFIISSTLVFISRPNGSSFHSHFSPIMAFIFTFLSILSILFGYFFKDLFIGFESELHSTF
ncbi:hypothetical protein BB560_000022 [Smittium megazygosporum]|uniref:NADH:quinone oxidoreductase/Mrp antiporter transmembrane domain-containing protein n=2 Tax=Smittium TaxID=4888 RepID=A0A2T9ZLJ2_9FUNG|nr:hypothetical protein BB560_000022 [Smittium megazygosporum]PWA00301.1 hypothetical protein BB558_003644 [Smittium angustum]